MSSLVSSAVSVGASTLASEGSDSNFDLNVREVGVDKIIKSKSKGKKMSSFMSKNKKKSGLGLKVSLRRSKKKNDPACRESDALGTSKGCPDVIHDDAEIIHITDKSKNGEPQKEDKRDSSRKTSIDYPSSPCNSQSTCDISYSSYNTVETPTPVEKRRLDTGHGDVIEGLEHIAFDQDSADITLLSSNGESVPAVRSQLIAQSPKFSSMISVRDEVNGLSEIPLDYDTLTIRAIVEFCYGGNIVMSLYSSKDCAARSLVWLIAASHYYEIYELERKARNQIHDLLSEWRPIACTVLDASLATEDHTTRDLASLAMTIIRANPRAVLMGPCDENRESEGGGVKSMSMAALCAILNDKKLYDDAIVMFHCLRMWAESDTKQQNEKIDRVVAARRLINKIQLTRIPPTELEKEVRESGLVTTAQLTDAYRGWARAVLDNERRWKSLSSLDSPLRRDKRGGIVIVRDAGIDEVNGVYIASSNKSVMIYSKVGNWEGGRVRFHLYRAKQNWHLGLPNRDTPIEFYCAPLRTDHVHIPPNNNWGVSKSRKMQCEGTKPSPSCVWISESPNLDDS